MIAESDEELRQERGEPGGVYAGEAFGRLDLRVALQDACAVLVDVPAYVDAEHLATEVSRSY